MSLPRIYSVYLNNLSWYQIQRIYKASFPSGLANTKSARITEIVDRLDVVPVDPAIEQHLFAGRVSSNWYTLANQTHNSLDHIKTNLITQYPNLFEEGRYPELAEGFEIIHAIEMNDKLLVTLGTGTFRDATIFRNYRMTSEPSEYFCTAVIRNSHPTLEVRANEMLRGQVVKRIIEATGIIAPPFSRSALPQETFMRFKEAIPQAQIRRYKGKSLDAAAITDIFDYTAKQNIDYAADISVFEQMRENLQDISLTITFDYDGGTYPMRLNLLTWSIYFPSITPESAIDYISSIYSRTILELS